MKIACLLSGGVDSSVALSLLHRQGHDLTAYYLKIWLEDDLSFLGNCPWEEDLGYAEEVCRMYDIPLEVLSLQREYYDRVVSYTIGELQQGLTPSPDLFCNKRIKFGVFFDRIHDMGFDRIATGHYAGIHRLGGTSYLMSASDPVKDQSYFLAHLGQDQLSRLLFPLGAYTKAQVRTMAEEFQLPNKDRKDSQGICFLGKIKYKDFVKSYLDVQPGDIVDIDTGTVLGPHQGVWLYTIGQRTGLGLSGGPWYVVKKDIPANKVYVSHGDHMGAYSRDSYLVGKFNWIAEAPEETSFRVKIRHGPQKYDANVIWDNPAPHETARIRLSESDQGIAPGQFTVFYSGERCLGCGTILE